VGISIQKENEVFLGPEARRRRTGKKYLIRLWNHEALPVPARSGAEPRPKTGFIVI